MSNDAEIIKVDKIYNEIIQTFKQISAKKKSIKERTDKNETGISILNLSCPFIPKEEY